jgi:hypothetical protein
MAFYPLHPPRSTYRGNNPERQRRAAQLYLLGARIVAQINREMQQCGIDESRMFTYTGVAHTLKADVKHVEAILQELGGGGGGITVVKRDPTKI